MKLNALNTNPKPAIVRKQQKRLHFTVRDIGGEAELARWKAEQAAADLEWERGRPERYESAKNRAVSILVGEVKPEFTELEKAELNYRRYKNTAGPQRTPVSIPQVEAPKPPSVWHRAKSAFLNKIYKVWRDAFPQ